MYIKRQLIFLCFLTSTIIANAQKLEMSTGPELLRSFNHHETFWGYGATAVGSSLKKVEQSALPAYR